MPSDAIHFAGGVYEVIPGRLAIGPMMHVKVLIQRPAGSPFGALKLVEPSSRFFVTCLPMTSSASPQPASSDIAKDAQPSHHQDPAAGTATVSSSAPSSTPSVAESPRLPSSATSTTPTPRSNGQVPITPMQESIARTKNSVADFMAKMKERQALARRPPSAHPSVPSIPGPCTSQSASTAAAIATTTMTPPAIGFASSAPADDGNHADQAVANGSLRQLATEALGANHYHLCDMAPDKLRTPQTADAIEFIRKTLADDPQAFIYVFSRSGKGRASALAMLYALQVEKMSLRDVTHKLPLSTPCITYMSELLELEKVRCAEAGKTSDFDGDGWFTKYFSIRYPDRNTKAVCVAVERCGGDYVRADRILQEEIFFAKSVAETGKRKELMKAANTMVTTTDRPDLVSQTFGGFDDREQSRLSFFTSTFTPPAADVLPMERHSSAVSHSALSLSKTTHDTDSTSARRTPAILGMPNLGGFATNDDAPLDNQSTVSGSSGSISPLPATALTPLDEDMIRTIVRALRTCDVAATPDEVRQSYLRHRRNKTKVIGDFLKSGADNTKLASIVQKLPTTVPSRTPRSSAAASSAQLGKAQDGGSFQQRARYHSTSGGSLRPRSPQPEKAPFAREQPSPDPERPSFDGDERTPSDIDDQDQTITSTVERTKLNAFTFPVD